MTLSTIDDMEDQDGSIIATDGRKGAWYTYNDMSGMQTPVMGDPFGMNPVPKPRSGSTYAAHTFGSNFTIWGAGFGFDFNNNGMAKAGYEYQAAQNQFR